MTFGKLTHPAVCSQFSDCQTKVERLFFNFVALLPDDPNVVVGENLILDCFLLSTSELSAQYIAFKFQPDNKNSQVYSFPVQFTSIVNDSLVRLNVSSISLDYDHASVTCFDKRSPQDVFDKQIIRVGCKL